MESSTILTNENSESYVGMGASVLLTVNAEGVKLVFFTKFLKDVGGVFCLSITLDVVWVGSEFNHLYELIYSF